MNDLNCPECTGEKNLNNLNSDKFRNGHSAKQGKLVEIPEEKGIFFCKQCRGNWYDWHKTPGNKFNKKEIYLEKNLSSLKKQEKPVETIEVNDKQYICPSCQSTLKRSSFLSKSGLDVFSCPEHGLFFTANTKELLMDVGHYWNGETENTEKKQAGIKDALELVLSFVGGEELLI